MRYSHCHLVQSRVTISKVSQKEWSRHVLTFSSRQPNTTEFRSDVELGNVSKLLFFSLRVFLVFRVHHGQNKGVESDNTVLGDGASFKLNRESANTTRFEPEPEPEPDPEFKIEIRRKH